MTINPKNYTPKIHTPTDLCWCKNMHHHSIRRRCWYLIQNGPRRTALFSIELTLLLQSQLPIISEGKRGNLKKKQRDTSTWNENALVIPFRDIISLCFRHIHTPWRRIINILFIRIIGGSRHRIRQRSRRHDGRNELGVRLEGEKKRRGEGIY